MNRTLMGLLARGIDSVLANKLIEQGLRVAKLKQKQPHQLRKLGLSDEQISAVHRSSRPPISEEVVCQLLYKSRRSCCVCRMPNLPIIIHHIYPWSESKDHRIENLAVLCLNCHGEAHTKRETAQNLTPERIQYSKQKWEEMVCTQDLQALIRPSSWESNTAMWDYFNHTRLLTLARSIQIDTAQILNSPIFSNQHFPSISDHSTEKTNVENPGADVPYFYAALNPIRAAELYGHFERLLYELLGRTGFVNLTSEWSRSSVNSIVRPGNIIACTGAFRFKWLHNHQKAGPGQNRRVRKSKRGIELHFQIDGWEATSSSAHHTHLSGIWVSTAVLLVRSVSRDEGRIIIACTCLAIGTGFTEYKGEIPEVAWKHMQSVEDDV